MNDNFKANAAGIFVPGSVKPEADYEEFSRLGAKLGLPCPQVHISLECRDQKTGELLGEFSDRSRTWARNYWNWLFKAFGLFVTSAAANNTSSPMASDAVWGAGHLTNKVSSGGITNTNTTNWFSSPTIQAAAGQAQGIVVGTGTGAENFDDTGLGTIIAHGVGAGQLSFQAQTMPTPTYNAGSLTWTAAHSRIFNNNSGGSISVNECAIYSAQGNGGGAWMLARDKLGAAFPVANAAQLTVTYTISLTFPG